MRWHSPSPAETRACARALAGACGVEGGVIALLGPLGAGKTVFAKGVAEALGLDPDSIASPTFVIANEYATPGGLRLVHADLYRLARLAELEATGWLDWLVPGTLLLVEWADRVPGALPADHLEVRIRVDPMQRGSESEAGAGERRIEVRAHGPLATAWLHRSADAAPSGHGGAQRCR